MTNHSPLRVFLPLLFALGLALLPSCSLFKKIVKEPTVEFKQMRLGNITPNAINLENELAISNPNSFDLPLDRFSYEVSINDSRLFAGETKDLPRLKARENTPAHLPIAVPTTSLKALRDIFMADKGFRYRLSGVLTVAGYDLRFTKEGRAGLPSFDWGKPQITEANFQRVTIELPLTLRNPNDFRWPEVSINYNLTLIEVLGLSNAVIKIPAIPPGEAVTVKIPLSLSPAAMGTGLIQLATKTDDVTLKLVGRVYTALGETSFERQQVVKLPMKKILPEINADKILKGVPKLFQ